MADRIQVATGDEIFNPRTGQRMMFRRTSADGGGRELIIECWTPPNSDGDPREPMHVHPEQEKLFRVVEGQLRLSINGEVRTLFAGEEIVIDSDAKHCFWNESDEEAHYFQEFRPALRTAEFFATLFALARDGEINKNGVPGPLQMAASGARFRHEITVTNPPPWLQRMMFVVAAPLARLMGRVPERR